MKKILGPLSLICTLLAATNALANIDEKDVHAPIPQMARTLVSKSRALVERDRFPEANSALKKAISIAPNYVNAHAEYIRMQADFLNRSDLVRSEYEGLMKREPNNPVYPMALALGLIRVSDASEKGWLQTVVDIAPEWSWSSYARGVLLSGKDPNAAIGELKKYIETEGSWAPAYHTLSYLQGATLKRLDEAIVTAEKMNALPNSTAWDSTYLLTYLWNLRLGKAAGTPQAKDDLRNELNRLVVASRDVKKLAAVRLAFMDLLDDKDEASKVADRIRRIDPTWYPERGRVTYVSARNVSGIQRIFVVSNRQLANFSKIEALVDDTGPEMKVIGLERLPISLKLSSELKRYLYERIFEAAVEVKDTPALVKYGKLLLVADPTDVAISSKVAIILADRNDSKAALSFATAAESGTRTFPLAVPRPANNRRTDDEWNKVSFSEERKRSFYNRMRSLALDALGWSNFKAGNIALAESLTKESIELERVERSLSHLAKILDARGDKNKAQEIAKEANELYSKNLKQTFTDAPAKDFELVTVDGRKVKLSDLKGKVVMIDFWATWCGPCVQSLPTLAKLYEKYGKQGFEILYISGDSESDKYKVVPFTKAKNIRFPVMLDSGVVQMYNVKAFPTTIFIDRQGKIRHRDTGFIADESPRKLETTVELLLQANGLTVARSAIADRSELGVKRDGLTGRAE